MGPARAPYKDNTLVSTGVLSILGGNFETTHRASLNASAGINGPIQKHRRGIPRMILSKDEGQGEDELYGVDEQKIDEGKGGQAGVQGLRMTDEEFMYVFDLLIDLGQ